MPRLLAATLLCLAAGCSEQSTEISDFGATQIARLFVDAERKCAIAGYTAVSDCAETASLTIDAGLAARRALNTYEIFQSGCYETMGKERCEGFMASAYAQATKAAARQHSAVQAPAPARSPAP